MNGKRLRVNDFKLTYGQETIYINMYAAFKNKKNGNKYAIYSYENKNKLNYGTFHQRDKEAVIMTSKENPSDIIKEYTESLLEGNKNDKYETILLKELETVQIIDEYTSDLDIDLNKLKNLTIPKEKEENDVEDNNKKPISIATTFFVVFLLVVAAFFFVNPEVIIGKDKHYSCTINYFHKTIPATVSEEILLTFSGKEEIKNIELTEDYVFNDVNYYQEFVDKSYYYQYMEEGDTYKLIDKTNTFRLFSNIDVNNEYFLPTEEQELLNHYTEKGYTCKRVEIDE